MLSGELRREAMIRAGLIQYFTNVINQNKKIDVEPVVYANIPWTVAHLALEEAYDNDSLETKIKILQNISCHNPGLLAFLIKKMNMFTY